jgi:predicted Zn-dependent protease/predicted Ser/Thr protein kinase
VKIGAYEVVRELARGGNAVVFEARSERGERVAIKLLRSLDPSAADRFAREADLLGQLAPGEGFVPLLGRGEAPEGPFLVMPFLEGGTLRDRMRKGPLPVAEVLAMARTLAAALGRAHERGIVHRDLKPENVLLDSAGEPWIADLGLGKLATKDAAGGLTKTGEYFGTVGYMAPEQIEGSREAGPAADVFALGAIAYECLAGQPPFPSTGLVSYAAALRSPPPALRALRPEVPAWLERAVASAVEREPGRRPPDGAGLLAALEPPPRRLAPLLAVSVGTAVLLGGGAAVLDVRSRSNAATAGLGSASVAAVATSAASGRSAEGRAEDSLDAAVERAVARSGKDPRAARDVLESLIAGHPGLAAAWRALCRLELRQRRPLEALAAAERVVALEGESASALRLRSLAELRLHGYRRAAGDASAALRLVPDQAEDLAVLAAAELGWAKHDEALRDGTAALAREPANALADFVVVKVLVDRQEWEKASALAEAGVAAAPGDALVWFARAYVRASQADTAGSRDDIKRALALDPGSEHANRIGILVSTIDQDRAAAFREALAWLERDPWDPHAWYEALRIAPKERRKGLWDQRRAFLLDHPMLEDFLEAFLLDTEEPDAAKLQLLDALLAKAPANAWAHLARGDLIRASDARAGLEEYDRAIAIRPREAHFAVDKASFLFEKGERAAARRELERCLALDPPSFERTQLAALEKELDASSK